MPFFMKICNCGNSTEYMYRIGQLEQQQVTVLDAPQEFCSVPESLVFTGKGIGFPRGLKYM